MENKVLRVSWFQYCNRVLWQSHPQNAYFCTAGSLLGSPVFKHLGWPNPLALFPVPPLGFAVMSKIMLSG